MPVLLRNEYASNFRDREDLGVQISLLFDKGTIPLFMNLPDQRENLLLFSSKILTYKKCDL